MRKIVYVNRVIRFMANPIVEDAEKSGAINLNEIAMNRKYTKKDHEELAQLIGYSVDGFCDLPYVSKKTKKKALRKAEKLRRKVALPPNEAEGPGAAMVRETTDAMRKALQPLRDPKPMTNSPPGDYSRWYAIERFDYETFKDQWVLLHFDHEEPSMCVARWAGKDFYLIQNEFQRMGDPMPPTHFMLLRSPYKEPIR